MKKHESINVLLEAAELQRQKAEDYQNPKSTVKQADYYPRGVWSIWEILNAKMLRAKSLIESERTTEANFESLEDTFKDIINYASFAIAWSRGKIPGQDPKTGLLNDGRVSLSPGAGSGPPPADPTSYFAEMDISRLIRAPERPTSPTSLILPSDVEPTPDLDSYFTHDELEKYVPTPARFVQPESPLPNSVLPDIGLQHEFVDVSILKGKS